MVTAGGTHRPFAIGERFTGRKEADMTENRAPVIAVVEWLTSEDREPAVFLADTQEDARRAVFQFLAPIAADGDIHYISSDWAKKNPTPDADDAAAVEAWLAALKEQSTDAWLTLYDRGTVPSSDRYADVRTGQ